MRVIQTVDHLIYLSNGLTSNSPLMLSSWQPVRLLQLLERAYLRGRMECTKAYDFSDLLSSASIKKFLKADFSFGRRVSMEFQSPSLASISICSASVLFSSLRKFKQSPFNSMGGCSRFHDTANAQQCVQFINGVFNALSELRHQFHCCVATHGIFPIS